MDAVVTRARSVQIEFFDRAPLRLSTIPAPPAIQGGVRFFVAVLPCPAMPKTLVARDAAGRVVARYASRQAPPKLLDLLRTGERRVPQHSGMSLDPRAAHISSNDGAPGGEGRDRDGWGEW